MDKYDSRRIAREIEDAVEQWWDQTAGQRPSIGALPPFRDELRVLLMEIARRIREVGT